MHSTPTQHPSRSLAIRPAGHKGPIRVFTPTIPRIRIPNTPGALSTALAPAAPEEGPAIRINVRQLRVRRRRARVRRAGAVGRAVRRVELVVRHEDGEGLRAAHPRVVAAFGGLDVFGDFGCCWVGLGTVKKEKWGAGDGPEQAVVPGHLPFVLDVAGSRVRLAR